MPTDPAVIAHPAALPDAPRLLAGLLSNRWAQLALGVLCMPSISSPHYVWTLFAQPFATRLGVAMPQVQVTFCVPIVL